MMAVDFTLASTQYIQYALTTDPTEVTWGCWVKPDDITTVYIGARIQAADPGTYGDELGIDAASKFCAYSYDTAGRTVTGTTIAVVGTWYHVALYRKNSDYLRLYVNGVEEGTAAAFGTAQTSTDSWRLGYRKFEGFDGQIEDFRLWLGAITSQTLKIWAAGYRGPIGSETIWCPMDGAQAIAHFDGTALAVNTNYLNDMSGGGYHGNPTNNPLGAASSCPRMGGITD